MKMKLHLSHFIVPTAPGSHSEHPKPSRYILSLPAYKTILYVSSRLLTIVCVYPYIVLNFWRLTYDRTLDY